MAFTKAQEEAITHFQGPAMVLAGPGSGKTTVITHRTSYLIEHYGDPSRQHSGGDLYQGCRRGDEKAFSEDAERITHDGAVWHFSFCFF